MDLISRLLAFLLTVVLGACGIFSFNVVEESASGVSIIGTVIENRIEVPADGNNVLVLQVGDQTITVLYEEGGLVPADQQANQCSDNPITAQRAQDIDVGATVEVFAISHEFYDYEVCSSEAYYVTVMTPDAPDDANPARTATGAIVDTIDDCVVDGICAFIIETEEGDEITVIWSEGDTPNCMNDPLRLLEDNAFTFELDTTIEAYGEFISDTEMTTCGDDAYYIDIVDNQDTLSDDQTATRQVTGEIVEIISDCAFDGICAYVVLTADGEEVQINWAEGMSMNCSNDMFQGQSNNDMGVGDTIDALGRVVDSTTISACGDESYYIIKQ